MSERKTNFRHPSSRQQSTNQSSTQTTSQRIPTSSSQRSFYYSSSHRNEDGKWVTETVKGGYGEDTDEHGQKSYYVLDPHSENSRFRETKTDDYQRVKFQVDNMFNTPFRRQFPTISLLDSRPSFFPDFSSFPSLLLENDSEEEDSIEHLRKENVELKRQLRQYQDIHERNRH